MQASLVLDLIVVIIVIGRAAVGARNGLVVGSLSLIGVVAGAVAGLWAAPRLVELIGVLDANRLARSITLIAVVVIGIGLGEVIFGALGRRLRGTKKKRATGLDAVLGGIAAALVVALTSWFVLTAIRPLAPAELGRAIDQSHSYQILDAAVPDQLNELPARTVDLVLTEIPKIFGGDEPQLPIPEPDTDALGNPQVQQAAASIVQVRTDAPNCRSDSTGSGWVAAPQRVVTNAHVVAGSSSVTVAVGGTGTPLSANVVAFDPDLDLAILAVPGLAAAPLVRASENQQPGTDAIAAGFPWGGPYTASQLRVRGTVTENGADIYGDTEVARQVYSLRGVVRPGNSGGPLLTDDGRVAGTVFAMSAIDAQTGYALTDAATASWLDAAPALSAPVPAGACLAA